LGFGVALDTRKRRNVDAAEKLLFALGMCAYAFAQGGLLACGEGESARYRASLVSKDLY